MTRRTIFTVAGLTLASGLSLVAVTNAWFINVDSTPQGEGITSALVRYLPEEQQRSPENLLAFGNLISGGSIDPDGIPLILPGDSLLASTYQNESGQQTVLTSTARNYESGDSAGTIITRKTRYSASGGTSVTQIQRDLMNGPHTASQWYELVGGAEQEYTGTPNTAGYTAVTTSTTDAYQEENPPAGITSVDVTVTAVTTTYTKIDKPTYILRQITTTKVSHEAVYYLPGGSTQADWQSCSGRAVTSVETVLAVINSSDNNPKTTRSSLLITDTAPGLSGGTLDAPLPIPLNIQNLSTVDTRVRLGLSVVLTPKTGTPYYLTPSSTTADAEGKYYFGTTNAEGKFIDLLVLQPDEGWLWNTEESDGKWALWDLNVSGDSGSTDVIPPIPTPAPSPGPEASAPPAAESQVLYTAVRSFTVAGRPHDSTLVSQEEFETSFNELYCYSSPTIQVRLRYYVRQSDYMEWSQFYTLDTDLTFGAAGEGA